MYVTVDDIKSSRVALFDGLPDGFIEKRLIDLSKVIDEYCNTTFKPTQIEWKTDLRLKVRALKKPLISIEEVKVLGEALVEDEDYYVYPEKNLIEFDDMSNYRRRKKALNLKYTYGYVEVPSIVKEVLLELLKDSLESANMSGKVKSEQWEDYQYTLADSTETTKNILSRLDRFIEYEDEIVEGRNKIRAMLL
jgi:hypothetical protein